MSAAPAAGACSALDFGCLDDVPKSQLAVIQSLHGSFARIFTESLALYLRSEVSAGKITVEQFPFHDFTRILPPSTCIACLSLAPYRGCALVEVSPRLATPVLEHLMGGDGRLGAVLDREITELEQEMLDRFFRIVARDLSEAWQPVGPIHFQVESLQTAPQSFKGIAANEGVVVAAMELRIGAHTGTVNFAIPSIALKALRQRFDRQAAQLRPPSQDSEWKLRRRMAQGLLLDVECTLSGARVRLRELLRLEVGHVVDLGVPIQSPVTAIVNGTPHFQGEIAVAGAKLAMRVAAAPGEFTSRS